MLGRDRETRKAGEEGMDRERRDRERDRERERGTEKWRDGERD